MSRLQSRLILDHSMDEAPAMATAMIPCQTATASQKFRARRPSPAALIGLAGVLTLAACANDAADPSLTPAQQQLKQANQQFTTTVIEGTAVGTLLGAGLGAVFGGGRGAAYGAAGGAAVGTL